METPAVYTQPKPRKALGDFVHCQHCQRRLGYEVNVEWYKQNRSMWVRSKTFHRIVGGTLVAKMHVRGEIVCECGRAQVWDG